MGGSDSGGGSFYMPPANNPLPPTQGQMGWYLGNYQPFYQGNNQSVNPLELSNNIDFPSTSGMPNSFPANAIPQGMANIQGLYNEFAGLAPSYFNSAQNATTSAMNASLPGMENIYGTGIGTQGAIGSQAQGQIAGLENQNMGQINGMLDNYTKSYLDRLGPNGDLGKQMMGEFNNYGITPSSGAFQDALGQKMGALGAENALTLGREALMPGIQAQYGALGQTLGSQLGTAQRGTEQAGQLSNLAATQNMTLGSEGAMSPLSYLNQALGQESSLLNQSTQLPIQYWQSQNEANIANQMGQQQIAAQNNAAQQAMLGNVFGSGLGAVGTAAAFK